MPHPASVRRHTSVIRNGELDLSPAPAGGLLAKRHHPADLPDLVDLTGVPRERERRRLRGVRVEEDVQVVEAAQHQVVGGEQRGVVADEQLLEASGVLGGEGGAELVEHPAQIVHGHSMSSDRDGCPEN